MKRLICIILLVLSFAGTTRAQITIQAYVVDTLNNAPLRMASVILIRASDSVIETFTRSGGDGHITLSAPKEGKYILKATYRGFADYLDVINVTKPVDLGVIPMLSKERLLKEFVITRQYAAIKIKGDTTEYIADSFRTKDNANVEDLLKKLPGIQVDKNGQITAQGETVAKILVDGEEFFSDDPKVVTKGLVAKAVDKVQVFDKKSDQAEFTGIDDGQRIKTINLELKDEYKKGYFGKVDAGGGTDGYFQNQAMVNGFKGKRQLSVFGIASNTDKVGLGWEDGEKYASGKGTTEITEDGGIMTYYEGSNDDFEGWDGKYNGEGLPKIWTGGAHYADKWNKDKEHVTGNYRYAMQNVEINGSTITQNPYSLQHSNKSQFSSGYRHAADGMFEWKVDSFTTVKLSVNGGLKDMKTSSRYSADAFLAKGDGNTYNDTGSYNNRTVTSDAKGEFLNADLLLRKKFAKKGRSLSVDLKENQKDNNSDGNFFSVKDSVVGSNGNGLEFGHRDTTDQQKTNSSQSLSFSGKITYTEPLSKNIFLETRYSATINNSSAKNISVDNRSQLLDSLYSSNYTFNILTNRGGLSFKYNGKKATISLGSDVSYTQYVQKDLFRDTTYKRNFINLFPDASYNYKFSKQTSFTLSYHGSTTQPTINQLQPLRNNTDPLNITIGNPSLKQEFDHTVQLRFNDYKVLTGRYMWASISSTFMQDDITTSQQILPNGQNITQYINANGNYNGYAYLGGGFRLKKLNAYIGANVGSNIYHNNNFINGVANLNNNQSIHFGLDMNYDKENKVSFNLNPSISYTNNEASVNAYSTHYTTFTTECSATVQLPKKFELGSSADIMIREKTEAFPTNNNVVKWNAYLGKKLLKKSNLMVALNVYDILNQNIGFSRNVSGINTTQTSYNTIRRYGLLNVVWNFNHSPSANTEEPETIEVK